MHHNNKGLIAFALATAAGLTGMKAMENRGPRSTEVTRCATLEAQTADGFPTATEACVTSFGGPSAHWQAAEILDMQKRAYKAVVSSNTVEGLTTVEGLAPRLPEKVSRLREDFSDNAAICPPPLTDLGAAALARMVMETVVARRKGFITTEFDPAFDGAPVFVMGPVNTRVTPETVGSIGKASVAGLKKGM